MVLYGAAFDLFDFHFPTRTAVFLVYSALVIIVATATRDGQRAVNPRFEALVELLEKQDSL